MKLSTLLLLVMGLFLTTASFAEEKSESEKGPVFIDYDGDGLDDYVQDLDSDGIPDFGNMQAYQREEAVQSAGTGIFHNLTVEPSFLPQLVTNAQKFSDLKCCVMALTQYRGGFGTSSDFGAISGLSQNTGGGNCAGGICK